jgi:pyrimidine-nucleoside phosphorylase
MVVMAGKAESPEKARKMLTEAVGSGKAFEKFREFIKSQGGDPTPAENLELFPRPPVVRTVEAKSEGYVHSIQAEKIGKAALVLGAGREKKDSSIDLSTGIVLSAKKGDWVSKGKSIATVYARNDKACSEAQDIILEAFEIGPESITLPPLVKGLVTAASEERY